MGLTSVHFSAFVSISLCLHHQFIYSLLVLYILYTQEKFALAYELAQMKANFQVEVFSKREE